MRAGLLERRLGAADPAVYHDLVDALAPQRHWRFDEASDTTALDRITGHSATLANGPSLGVDPLVRKAAGGKSIGLKGGPTPAYMTIADLVTSPAFTLDVALQVDQHPGAASKYLIATTGGGSTPGEVSVEIEDDGAFGLWVRCWSVDDGGTPIIRHTDPRTVPIGSAFKLAYRRNGDGTQSVLIDGVAQTLTTERGSDPGGWSAVPSATWYIGVWPTLAAPFKGLIAELVAWQSAVADAALLSLARTRNVVWLGDFDAGSANQNSTRTIDTTPYAFPTTGLIAVRDADGALGTVASNGAAFDYLAGATDGADSFTGHVERAGSSSRIATIGVTVAAGQVKDGTPTDDAVPAGFVNPIADHAATGDGVADDTAELQAALDAGRVWIAPGEDYRITGTVVVNRGHAFKCWGGRILFDRSANDVAAVRLNHGSGTSARPWWVVEGLRVINQNQSDWSNAENRAVHARNLWGGFIDAREIDGFTVGLVSHGVTDTETGIYNYVWHQLGEIRNCGIGIELRTERPGSGGQPWTNSNWYFCGRILVEDGVNTSSVRTGVLEHSPDDSHNLTNHNSLYCQSFELNAPNASAKAINVQRTGVYSLCWGLSDESGGTFQSDGAGDVLMRWDSVEQETAGAGSMHEIGYGYTTAKIDSTMLERINPPHWSSGDPHMAYDRRRLTDGGASNNLEDIGGVIT